MRLVDGDLRPDIITFQSDSDVISAPLKLGPHGIVIMIMIITIIRNSPCHDSIRTM